MMWLVLQRSDDAVSSLPSDRSLDSIARSRQESLSSVEEDDYDTLDDIDSDKNIVRTKVFFLFESIVAHI